MAETQGPFWNLALFHWSPRRWSPRSAGPTTSPTPALLTGCVVVPLGETEAHEAGRLLGITKTSDVVDAPLW